MKKTYIAPMMEREIFETSDVITASIVFNAAGYDAGTETDAGIPVVDAATLEYKN